MDTAFLFALNTHFQANVMKTKNGVILWFSLAQKLLSDKACSDKFTVYSCIVSYEVMVTMAITGNHIG